MGSYVVSMLRKYSWRHEYDEGVPLLEGTPMDGMVCIVVDSRTEVSVKILDVEMFDVFLPISKN